jgi:hypothetical protein
MSFRSKARCMRSKQIPSLKHFHHMRGPARTTGHGSKTPTQIECLQEAMVFFHQSSVSTCVEINQCVGCFGDDVAALAPSSSEEPTSPRHRTGAASMAWRSARRFRTNVP